MQTIWVGLIFIVLAWLTWTQGSQIAYMMAWFFGAGALAYTIGAGLGEGALSMWALVVGLALVGLLRDRLRPN